MMISVAWDIFLCVKNRKLNRNMNSVITKTCNIYRDFLSFKNRKFSAEKNLSEAVLTSTHNLCFGGKIRKIGIPLHTPVFLYKSGVHGGKM